MTNDEVVEIIERGLCVTVDMRDDSPEDSWLIRGRRTDFCIQVLKLDLLSAEVIAKSAESRGSIFFAVFIFKSI